MGGLGNQLFQIFTTISYSIESKNPFQFLNVSTLGGGSCTMRYTFWDTFFYKLKPFLVDSLPAYCVISETCFTYKEISIDKLNNLNVMLSGYFQSYKYFEKNYNTICKLIDLQGLKKNVINKLELTNEYLDNTISMHFRLGDYKKVSDFHPLIIKYDYYEKCLEYIKNTQPDKNFTILYFCEDEDIDDVSKKINELENMYPQYNFERCNNTLSDWEQMILMSCCHHNIIANSSFSWWSAYFNSHNDKIICYPSIWFGAHANIQTQDLFPLSWMCIKC